MGKSVDPDSVTQLIGIEEEPKQVIEVSSCAERDSDDPEEISPREMRQAGRQQAEKNNKEIPPADAQVFSVSSESQPSQPFDVKNLAKMAGNPEVPEGFMQLFKQMAERVDHLTKKLTVYEQERQSEKTLKQGPA